MSEMMIDLEKRVQLLNAVEVAEILNISRALAYRLMQTRDIPSVHISTARRVRPVDLLNFINDNLIPENS